MCHKDSNMCHKDSKMCHKDSNMCHKAARCAIRTAVCAIRTGMPLDYSRIHDANKSGQVRGGEGGEREREELGPC